MKCLCVVRWVLRRQTGLAPPTLSQPGQARSGSGQKVSQSSSFDDAGLATGVGLMTSFAASEGTVEAVVGWIARDFFGASILSRPGFLLGPFYFSVKLEIGRHQKRQRLIR